MSTCAARGAIQDLASRWLQGGTRPRPSSPISASTSGRRSPPGQPGRSISPMKQPRRFETRAVHSGEHRAGAEEGRDGIFYPISTPIYASTTFSHPNIETTDRVLGGEEQGYSYARYDNPTVRAFEEALVSLEAPEAEAGVRAFAFASGMAATHAALAAAELTGGGTVLAADQLYGSTVTLLGQIFGASRGETRFVDAYDLGAGEQ